MTESSSKNAVGRTKSYTIYMMSILILVQILDAYTTTFTSLIPSKIIEEFLANYSVNMANSIIALCIAIASLGTYFMFLNQYLADRVGRKKLLALTVFGIGLSSFLLSTSTNIIQYTIYLFMLYVFFSSDIWLIYINEESEPEKRGFNINIIMALGSIGIILAAVFRSIFITDTSPVGSWRAMTYFPIILGFVLAVLIIFTLKETTLYEEKKGLETNTIAFKENIQALFSSTHRKEYIALLMMSFLVGLCYIITQLVESYIVTYTRISEITFNIILLILILSIITGYFLTGILADKIGRIPLLYMYSAFIPIAIIFILIGTNMTQDSLMILFILIGVILLFLGFNLLHLVIRIVTMEIIPTERRGTGSGIRALLFAIGATSGLLLGSLLTFYFGLGIAFAIISIPILINIIIIKKLLKETKGIDLRILE